MYLKATEFNLEEPKRIRYFDYS